MFRYSTSKYKVQSLDVAGRDQWLTVTFIRKPFTKVVSSGRATGTLMLPSKLSHNT